MSQGVKHAFKRSLKSFIPFISPYEASKWIDVYIYEHK